MTKVSESLREYIYDMLDVIQADIDRLKRENETLKEEKQRLTAIIENLINKQQ